jgi:feruloyl esterase
MKKIKFTGLLLMASVVVASGCAQMGTEPAAKPLALVKPITTCAALMGVEIPAASVGLPTSGGIVSASKAVTDVDTAGNARSYCVVTGIIKSVDTTASPIRFQVNLPDSWNQRMLQFGGGGTNGTVVTGLTAFSGAPVGIPTPLARGYVTLGSDSGHDSAGKPPFDTSFALKQEELMNFAQWQVKKTIDVAKWLTQRLYGQRPSYTYFAGGSQGGHEGFDAAQRYPDDYNGVIAHYPAFNVINMWLGAQAQARAVYGNQLGIASAAWMNPTKVANLVVHVRDKCDALDGIADGIISNVNGCNAIVTVDSIQKALRCINGEDTGDTCLSDAQLSAVAKIASSTQYNFAFADGRNTYPRWPLLEGGTFIGNHLGKTNTANLAKFPFTPDGTAFQLFPAKGGIQGFITQNLNQDPLAFDPNQAVQRIKQVSAWTDATSTDLKRFSAKGGKLLLTHGTVDDSITPHNTTAYWDKLVASNGQNAVDQFARFYMIPGMGHGSGIFNARHDWLATLEAWVEQGKKPGKLVTQDENTVAATISTNGRSRPLCLYGTWPKYIGPGNPSQAQANAAANFSCASY